VAKKDALQIKVKKLFTSKPKIVLAEWHRNYLKYGRNSLVFLNYFKVETLYPKKFDETAVNYCLPGDIVYFKNDEIYSIVLNEIMNIRKSNIELYEETIQDSRFSSFWSGEFCICTSKGKFAGFGLRENENSIEFSFDEIKRKLFKAANDMYSLGLILKPIKDKLIKSKKKPSISGIMLDPRVYRVNTSEIVKKL
jgi:signal peptidase I